VKKADESSLLHQGNRFEEAIKLLRVLSGVDKGQRREIVCLNASPLLCITDNAGDLREGMDKAADIINSGKPIKKLKAWVAEQNSDPSPHLEKLEELLALACG
jgi:anthranilate phosphoribosyltransferase